MYCQKCGSMYDDGQPCCPYCKTPRAGVNNSQFHGLMPPLDQNGRPCYDLSDTPPETGIIILSLLVPFVGIIFGCICLKNNEKRAGNAYLLAAAARYIILLFLVFAFVFHFFSFFTFFL